MHWCDPPYQKGRWSVSAGDHVGEPGLGEGVFDALGVSVREPDHGLLRGEVRPDERGEPLLLQLRFGVGADRPGLPGVSRAAGADDNDQPYVRAEHLHI